MLKRKQLIFTILLTIFFLIIASNANTVESLSSAMPQACLLESDSRIALVDTTKTR